MKFGKLIIKNLVGSEKVTEVNENGELNASGNAISAFANTTKESVFTDVVYASGLKVLTGYDENTIPFSELDDIDDWRRGYITNDYSLLESGTAYNDEARSVFQWPGTGDVSSNSNLNATYQLGEYSRVRIPSGFSFDTILFKYEADLVNSVHFYGTNTYTESDIRVWDNFCTLENESLPFSNTTIQIDLEEVTYTNILVNVRGTDSSTHLGCKFFKANAAQGINVSNLKYKNDSSTILYEQNSVFFDYATPGTGNISQSLTNANEGVVAKIYHNDSSEPSYPANWVLIGGGTYQTNTLNIITAEYVDDSRIEYRIEQ